MAVNLRSKAAKRNPKSSSLSTGHLLLWILSVTVAYSLGLICSSYSSIILSSAASSFGTSSSSHDAPSEQELQAVKVSSSRKKTLDPNEFTCKGFFTMMVSAFVKTDNTPQHCRLLYNGRFRPLLEDHSQQMIKMNTTMTFFTTWTEEQLQDEGCHLNDLPGLKMQQFNHTELLLKHGFTHEQINWMKGWHDAAFKNVKGKPSRSTENSLSHPYKARLADIFRIVLAKEYQMAYIELDMMLLSPYPEVYLAEPMISAPVWADELGSLEIQNSGFCLSRPQLDVILKRQRDIMQSKGPKQLGDSSVYRYTEMGPNVLNNVIQQLNYHQAVKLYLTICNDDANIKKAIKKHQKYNQFVWLHLDSRFRGSAIERLPETYQEIRATFQPPPLHEILPTYYSAPSES